MSPSPLPVFRYHPDPVATGSFKVAPGRCPHCGLERDYVYDGPIYAEHEPEPPCPTCIADGSFADRYDAEFTDSEALAGLPNGVVDEVARRTPGYSGWQQEEWMTHCDDAAVFLGPVGYRELVGHPDALESLSREMGDDDVKALAKNGSPTAYLFRCRHCRVEIANWDVD